MTEICNIISIQVGLSGYSFKIQADSGDSASGWLGAETIFTVPQMQRRYSEVEISVFTPLCTLIPSGFHKPELTRGLLADVVELPENAVVEYVSVPEYDAVLAFSNSVGGTLPKVVAESVLKLDGTKGHVLPEMYHMLKTSSQLKEYNRVVASYMDEVLYLVIAQGKSLLLCNTYPARDFTTAEYYIFLAMKKLQLNPEMSSICFRTPMTEEEEMSLYRYFKSVDRA